MCLVCAVGKIQFVKVGKWASMFQTADQSPTECSEQLLYFLNFFYFSLLSHSHCSAIRESLEGVSITTPPLSFFTHSPPPHVLFSAFPSHCVSSPVCMANQSARMAQSAAPLGQPLVLGLELLRCLPLVTFGSFALCARRVFQVDFNPVPWINRALMDLSCFDII